MKINILFAKDYNSSDRLNRSLEGNDPYLVDDVENINGLDYNNIMVLFTGGGTKGLPKCFVKYVGSKWAILGEDNNLYKVITSDVVYYQDFDYNYALRLERVIKHLKGAYAKDT